LPVFAVSAESAKNGGCAAAIRRAMLEETPKVISHKCRKSLPLISGISGYWI
jgi:hypothetical protein